MMVGQGQDGSDETQLIGDDPQDRVEQVHSGSGVAVKAARISEICSSLTSSHSHQRYLEKRNANNAFWTKQAIRHGTALEATASTDWVRAASLRRVKRLVTPGDSTLEVGCGNASSLLGPLSRYCRAYGADLTLEMLVAAKRKHDQIKGLVRADACRLPFPDGKFNVVNASRCLINVLDSAMQFAAIREVSRVAKPEGTVILIENFEEPVAAINRAIEDWCAGSPIRDDHNLPLNLGRTQEFGRENGWHPVRVYGNTLPSFVHTVIRKIGPGRGARVSLADYSFLCSKC